MAEQNNNNDNPQNSDEPTNRPHPKPDSLGPIAPRAGIPTLFIILALAGIVFLIYYTGTNDPRTEISWGDFCKQLERQNVQKVEIQGSELAGEFREIPKMEDLTFDETIKQPQKIERRFFTEISPLAFAPGNLDKNLNELLEGNYRAKKTEDNTIWLTLLFFAIPMIIFIVFWIMMRRAQDRMMGGVNPNFQRSQARLYQSGAQKATFRDVAGLEGVKKELEEIVDYLRHPERYKKMGARVPKGTLLLGPPGTGKTLLARAIAGEADVPFYSINGSEFIQLYVGVGASRVRDLFDTAKAHAPAILFIDEIDAVGRERGSGLGGGHDEREQTLNQILSEMDGFEQSDDMVMVLASTNRPDVLDPALLRPGRFDRHITVDRPTLKGRIEMFQVHMRKTPVADDVDIEKLARSTVGFTGADIRNLVNEATLWATRQNKEKVEQSDFDYAHVKVVMGLKREETLNESEKRKTAWHEAGHTIVGWFKPVNSRVHKVSIIPRGRALGATMVTPEEEQLSISETQLRAEITFLMGGRVAERLYTKEYSAGAENDLKRATQLARRMVIHWGMSQMLGPIAFRVGEAHPFLGREISETREYSEETARIIDNETVEILRSAETDALVLLEEKRSLLETLAERLVKDEELEESDIETILGPCAFKKTELS
ncbi:MAG: ATP-dependent zinc metalloprotease FtsH [Planctomycetaceae bacterium]|jgi:cell division protease FtsH|nr:ATP-dependent zinc metalloprotease FtsH [Planctomycetaceae bacterium]